MKLPFYLTTTIPYVNADPHIGFALELVQSDAIARYARLCGREVFFSTGTDEHGQKILEASAKEGRSVQEYVDAYAGKFLALQHLLHISNDHFIRTTHPGHLMAAEAFWRLCDTKGDIYKKKYTGLYCVGCEKFLADRDMVDGKCPLHPTIIPEMIEEENYFFKLTRYKKELLAYLAKEKSIIPEWRRAEAIDFVKSGMEDFSISRDRKRCSWGVPVPGDDTQVMYVWFDAFINYISTLGWPGNTENFEKFWKKGEKVQTAGKDMVKFQSVMWQGMLMSADLPTTDTVVYHGFITGEGGIKMSKSLGNVVSPNEIVKAYDADALRYFLLREISPFEDSPFTKERFKDAYNANLANGLGNLVSRIMKMAEEYLDAPYDTECCRFFPPLRRVADEATNTRCRDFPKEYADAFAQFNVQAAAEYVSREIARADKKIQDTEPFKLVKKDKAAAQKIIAELVGDVSRIAFLLTPFIPHTAEQIQHAIAANKMPPATLFPRRN